MGIGIVVNYTLAISGFVCCAARVSGEFRKGFREVETKKSFKSVGVKSNVVVFGVRKDTKILEG